MGAWHVRHAPLPSMPGVTWWVSAHSPVGRFAIQADAKAPRDMEVAHYQSFGAREPYGQGIGPFKPRGEPTGVILRGGYVVATWGEPDRVDMTHSVTKSFLSSVVGVAFDRGTPRDELPAYVGPTEPAAGHVHEWGAAMAETSDDGPLEGPALAPYSPAAAEEPTG